MEKQKLKECYVEAELDVVMLRNGDVIATSGNIDSSDTDWGGIQNW